MNKRFFFLAGFGVLCTLLLQLSTLPVVAQPQPTVSPIYIIVTNTPTPVPSALPSAGTPQYLIVTNTPAAVAPIYVVVTNTPDSSIQQQGFIDHFVFRRPFGNGDQTYWARNYSYGSTNNRSLRPHHGIDITNPPGTQILAVAGGRVYYAGSDSGAQLFGPQPNFYGNLVVLEHFFKDASGQTVYTLYGHISKALVNTGDVVQAGQPIAIIGSAGVAAGTHLHLEVRVGDPTSYAATHNPELWLVPDFNRGVIAGRAVNKEGQPLYGIRIEAASPAGTQGAFVYADDGLNGDTLLDENFVIPDLPAGEYTVVVRDTNMITYFRQKLSVAAGQTSWIEIVADAPLPGQETMTPSPSQG